MKRLFFGLLFFLHAASAAQAQLPGFFNDVLRNIQKPAPAERQQNAPSDGAAPGTPGLFSSTSVEEEVRIGRQLAGNLLGAAALVNDEKLQRYVNRVGRWVATQSERPDLKWHFGVLGSDSVNAFALPGGYVFVTHGLYKLLADEAELAGVLGHEIGHVVLQHHLKVLKQGQAINLLGNLMAQQQGQSAAAQAMLGKGAEALTRGLDKSAEFEADQVGVVLAARAGYVPYGLPNVLRKIGQRNPREASLSLLFKTHPLPQERLEKLGDTMGASFDRYTDSGKALSERFAAQQ
jgi:predicted Zn-dependent protease